MFDSPIEWCRVCKAWVAIDQTPTQCAREHDCAPGECPLAALLRCDEEPRPGLLTDRSLELR